MSHHEAPRTFVKLHNRTVQNMFERSLVKPGAFRFIPVAILICQVPAARKTGQDVGQASSLAAYGQDARATWVRLEA